MVVNCPHCRQDLELSDPDAREPLRCPCCDGEFDPFDDPPSAFRTQLEPATGPDGMPLDGNSSEIQATAIVPHEPFPAQYEPTPPTAPAPPPRRAVPPLPAPVRRPTIRRPTAAPPAAEPPPLPRWPAVDLHRGPTVVSVVSLAVIVASLVGIARMPSAAEGVQADQTALNGFGRYAGVEIASGGVRTVVVDFVPKSGMPYEIKLRHSDESKVQLEDLADDGRHFKPEKLDEARKAIKEFADRCRKEFNVPHGRLRVVSGSGLRKAFADPAAAETAELALSEIARQTTDVRLEYMLPSKEAEYGALACVRVEDRPTTAFVDVGSGDIKGGYYSKSRFNYVEISKAGLREVRKAVMAEAERTPDRPAFLAAVDRLRTRLLDAPLRDVSAQTPQLANAPGRVVLVGGAAWALATLTHPVAGEGHLVQVLADDFGRFERLRADLPRTLRPAEVREAVRAVAFDPPPAEADRAAAEAAVEKVLAVFDGPRLIAAGVTMAALADALQLRDKRVDVHSFGLYAMPIGYLVEESGLEK